MKDKAAEFMNVLNSEVPLELGDCQLLTAESISRLTPFIFTLPIAWSISGSLLVVVTVLAVVVTAVFISVICMMWRRYIEL